MKQPEWQRAWDCFLQALDRGKFPEYCLPPLPEKDKRFFWQMVRAIRRAGISVQIKNWLAEALDNNGSIVFITGYTLCERSQNPRPSNIHILISPRGKFTVVLSHEFAHAADYLLHGYYGSRQMEITALTAGYLFTCKHLEIHSSILSMRYAQRLGIKSRDILQQKRRILAVFRKMNSLFRKGQNSART